MLEALPPRSKYPPDEYFGWYKWNDYYGLGQVPIISVLGPFGELLVVARLRPLWNQMLVLHPHVAAPSCRRPRRETRRFDQLAG